LRANLHVCAADRSVHCGFADTAKGGETSDLIRTKGKIGGVALWLARRSASEAEEFAGCAFLSPGLLPFLNESLQHGAVNNNRAAVINRGEPLFEPMPNGVAVNAKELGDVRRIIAAQLLDPMRGIRLPLGFLCL
jgi:hypothetical protein